jgi:hypothetical protein
MRGSTAPDARSEVDTNAAICFFFVLMFMKTFIIMYRKRGRERERALARERREGERERGGGGEGGRENAGE